MVVVAAATTIAVTMDPDFGTVEAVRARGVEWFASFSSGFQEDFTMLAESLNYSEHSFGCLAAIVADRESLGRKFELVLSFDSIVLP